MSDRREVAVTTAKTQPKREVDLDKLPPIPANPPALPPIYSDIKERGHVFHVHCQVCGALWTGQWGPPVWIIDERRWVKRPQYDGGVIVYVSQDGREWTYGCRCEAGRMKPVPAVPDWLWRHAQRMGGSGCTLVIRYAEVTR